MNAVISPLWSLWRPFLWLFGVLGCCALALLMWSYSTGVLNFAAVALLVGFPVVWQAWSEIPWRWRLSRPVRRLHTATSPRMVAHWGPDFGGTKVPSPLHGCETVLDELTRWFGFPLPRPTVFLFPPGVDVCRLLKGPAGCAFPVWNAVVLSNGCYAAETLRHELAHLFSSRWNVWALPLLNEGLATWLQGTVHGQSIDAAAVALLRCYRGLELSAMLRRRSFYAADNQTSDRYILAGSFTGFLLRRYGWRRYRDLFQRAIGLGFRTTFRRRIGVSLEKAEWQWRNEVLVMEVLGRRLERELRS
jgi:hypothetical protein